MIRHLTSCCWLLVAGCWLLVGSALALQSPRAASSVTPGTKAMLVIPPKIPSGFTLTLSTNLPVKIFAMNRLGEAATFYANATNSLQISNDQAQRFFTTGAEIPIHITAPMGTNSVAGFNIYYGSAAGDYQLQRIPIGLVTDTTMTVLYIAGWIHITVTASYTDGTESEFGAPELVVFVPPAFCTLKKN